MPGVTGHIPNRVFKVLKVFDFAFEYFSSCNTSDLSNLVLVKVGRDLLPGKL